MNPTKRTLPCSLALRSASAAPFGRMNSSGSFSKRDAVDLPEIEVIGLQAAQRLFEHLRWRARRSRPWVQTLVIRKTLSRRPLRPLPIQSSRLAAMIFPAVVEECDAAVDGLLHDANRGLLVLRVAEVMAAEAERGDFYVGVLAERAHRHGGDACGLTGGSSLRILGHSQRLRIRKKKHGLRDEAKAVRCE